MSCTNIQIGMIMYYVHAKAKMSSRGPQLPMRLVNITFDGDRKLWQSQYRQYSDALCNYYVALPLHMTLVCLGRKHHC